MFQLILEGDAFGLFVVEVIEQGRGIIQFLLINLLLFNDRKGNEIEFGEFTYDISLQFWFISCLPDR